MQFLLDSFEYLKLGGWVMIPLAVCSFFLWLMITERVMEFNELWSRDLTVEDAVRAVEGERVDSSGNGLRARLVQEFLAGRSGQPELDRRILRHAAYKLERSLTKSLAVISVLAAVSPVMGLLGTVLGMIETFNVISSYGTGNAKALAGGVSVALVTTQAGLLVAIPGVFVSGVLWRRSKRLKVRLQESLAILDRSVRNGVVYEGGNR